MLKTLCGFVKGPSCLTKSAVTNSLPVTSTSLTAPSSLPSSFNREARAIIERDKRKRRLFEQTESHRLAQKALFMDQRQPKDWRYFMLRYFPFTRRGSRTLIKNRCWMSGRSRGVYAEFGLCRIKFRDLIVEGDMHGIKKASW
eukprot:TRINITY_DN3897_c0_g1_i1.p1 TRINITY_DN3897_c0_g1~~TRINITY_DN3897_c0_g1_i1.p1  ORF type:complete len:143 (-),score=7.54 TRINITY_DN3897_c0_g1_i1:45-473(-)